MNRVRSSPRPSSRVFHPDRLSQQAASAGAIIRQAIILRQTLNSPPTSSTDNEEQTALTGAQVLSEQEEDGEEKQRYRTHLYQLLTQRRGLIVKAAQLALEFRTAEAEHRNEVFLFATILALMKDVPDMFTFGISTMLTWAITIFLFIFLWGRGTWAVRIVLALGSLFELIPFVNILPVETLCVLYAWVESTKQAEKDKNDAEEQEKHTENLKKELSKLNQHISSTQ